MPLTKSIATFLPGLGLGVLLLCASSPARAAESYKIDPTHTFVNFKVKHLGVSQAFGRFNQASGAFTVDESNPARSTVSIEIRTESIDTNDAKRDQHLRSPDFFNAKQFPAITFKSQSVKKTGDASFEVTGDLTLHGVTRTLTLKLDRIGAGPDPWGGHRMGFETSFSIKRSDFDMKYMLDALGDDVHITVGVEGVREGAK